MSPPSDHESAPPVPSSCSSSSPLSVNKRRSHGAGHSSRHESVDAEKAAQSVMSAYSQGDMTKVQRTLWELGSPVMDLVITRSRELGNKAFRDGKYRQAIDCYNQALVGIGVEEEEEENKQGKKQGKKGKPKKEGKENKQKNAGEENVTDSHKLLSNRSACYLNLKEYDKALRDAAHAIRLKPQWSKGWYRAGRVLYEEGRYADSHRVFQVALKRHDDRDDNSDLTNWCEKTEKMADKDRMMERVTTDYRRFEAIGQEDENVQDVSQESAGGPVIEFNEGVSEEQKRNLEAMLLGVPQKAGPAPVIPMPKFNPAAIFADWAEIRPRAESSESSLPAMSNTTLRGHDMLEGGVRHESTKTKKQEKEDALLGLSTFLQFTSEVRAPRKVCDMLDNFDGLVHPVEGGFLFTHGETGSGTWYSALQGECRQTLREREGVLMLGTGTCVGLVLAAREAAQQPDLERPITACVAYISASMTLAARQMLLRNGGLSKHVALVSKRCELMTCSSSSTSHLDDVLGDLNDYARLVVIDPTCMDEALIGKRLLHIVRHARKKLCAPENPLVLPCSARIFVQCVSIRVRPTRHLSWSWLDKNRWSPYPERVQLAELEEACDIQFLTQPVQVFSYTFDGPLDDLDKDIPLRQRMEVPSLRVEAAGSVNALLISFDLLDREQGVVATSRSPWLRERLGESNQVGGFWSECIQWIDDVAVEQEQHITLEASHTPTRVRFKITSPTESPVAFKQATFPRWQLDMIKDDKLLQLWETALANPIHRRLERERTRELSKPNPVSLLNLCCGSGPLALCALRCAAVYLRNFIGQPCPEFHVTGVDPLLSHLLSCKAAARQSADQLVEETLRETPEVQATNGTLKKGGVAWMSFVEQPQEEANPQKNSASLRSADADSTELSRTKVSRRLSLLRKDLRQVRPPKGYETAESRIAFAQAVGLPLQGGDLASQMPEAEKDDHLKYSTDILTGTMFDVGGIGEGVLPLLHYWWQALANKKGAVVVPGGISIYGVAVELGHREVFGVDVAAWRTYRFTTDYGSLDLCRVPHRILSNPVQVFSFDLSYKGIMAASRKGFQEVVDFPLTVTNDGNLNAFVFWFELKLGPDIVVSTAPRTIPEEQLCWARDPTNSARQLARREKINAKKEDTGPSANNPEKGPPLSCDDPEFAGSLSTAPSTPGAASTVVSPPSPPCSTAESRSSTVAVHRTYAWRQAFQVVEEFAVHSGESVSIGAAHDASKVMFRVNKDTMADYDNSKTGVPVSDPLWCRLSEQHTKLTREMSQTMYTNKDANKQAVEAAVKLAVDPGRQSAFVIDPQEAAWFALALFL